DQTKFDAARTEETVTYTTTNPLTGATGTTYTTYYKIGSSSDRVDNALNSILPVNTAPVANDDTSDVTVLDGSAGGAAVEAGTDENVSPHLISGNAETTTVNATGNVILNGANGDTADTDADGDTITLTEIKADTGATFAVSGSAVNVDGQYGTLTINADGSYTYAVDNTNAAVDALLRTDPALSDKFTYTISDGNGGTATAVLTIKIVGSNDVPLAADDSNNAKESIETNAVDQYVDGTDLLGVIAIGNVLDNDTDVDANDSKTIVGSTISGAAEGTTANAGSGVSTLSFSELPNNVSVGYFVFYDDNQTIDDDSKNATLLTDSSNTAITVTSIDTVNKTFTLSSAVANYSNLDGKILGFANSAKGAAYKETQITTLATTGTSTVDLTNYTGSIAVGMTVSGGGLAAGTVVTKVTYDTNGDLESVDINSSTTLSSASLSFSAASGAGTSILGEYGLLLLNADGSYTYTPTANNVALSEGEVAQDKFTYTMQDTAGTQSKATLTINVYGSGTNDPIATDDLVTADEVGTDSNYTETTLDAGNDLISGNIFANDKETYNSSAGVTGSNYVTALSFQDGNLVRATNTADGSGNFTLVGKYGYLVLNSANGSYDYQMATDSADLSGLGLTAGEISSMVSAVDALDEGDVVDEVFGYVVTNTLSGAGYDFANLTIRITGANDAPIAADENGLTGTVSGPAITGQVFLNDSDVDADDTKTVTEVVQGDLDNSTNHVLTSLPGSSDVSPSATLTGTYGTLTINADGTFDYSIDSSNAALIALPVGQSATEVFTYRMEDSQGRWSDATLTFTINGENEPPVNDYPSAVTVTGNSYTFSGSDLLSVTDVDGNLSSVTLHVDHGTLDVDATLAGAVTGDTTSDVVISGTQAEINAILATLVYTPTNGYVGNDYLTIFSQDSNNAYDSDGFPILMPTETTATVNEADLGSANGAVASGDLPSKGDGTTSYPVDTGETFKEYSGTYGTLKINDDGTFEYTLSGAQNHTGALYDTIQYVVYDQYGNSITNTVKVAIADDVPFAVADANTVAEGGTVQGNVNIDSGDDNADDFGADGARAAGAVVGVRADGSTPDTTTEVTVGIGSSIQGDHGTLVLLADGSYTYTSNPNSISTNVQDVFVYTIEDADGDRSTTTLTINVQDFSLTASAADILADDQYAGVTPSNQFTTTLAPSGGTGPYTYAIASGHTDPTYGSFSV
ncbi:MAG: hypothetical protein HWE12_15745, partial [Oceanospirillaceae bacterium]|nr:hypothetical protein [Oceanospirillaceae bacterium]